MTNFDHEPKPFDPEELASRLDDLLSDSGAAPLPGEDVLAETAARLWNAPRPEIDPAMMARIQQQVLDSVPPTPPAGGSFPLNPPILLIVVGVVIVIITVIVIAVSSGNTPAVTPRPEPTLMATTAAPSATVPGTATYTPTATDTLTATNTAAATVTDTVVPSATTIATEAGAIAGTAAPTHISTATDTPTATHTPTATDTPTATVTPSITPTGAATLPVLIIIEGTVDAITPTTITIHGIEIDIDPANPLNQAVQVGDLIRIEGGMGEGTVITIVTITFVNIDVYVNSSTGEVFRDDSSCANPPPDWAVANGWRRRCQGASNPGGNGNGNGNANGNGNGNANGNGNGNANGNGNGNANGNGMGMGMGDSSS